MLAQNAFEFNFDRFLNGSFQGKISDLKLILINVNKVYDFIKNCENKNGISQNLLITER